MFSLLFLLLALLLISSISALLKKRHFRGYSIPVRFFYAVLLVDEIWVAMRTWYSSVTLTLLMLVITLALVGLLETDLRNKLQNQLSKRLLEVTGLGFILTFGVLLVIRNQF